MLTLVGGATAARVDKNMCVNINRFIQNHKTRERSSVRETPPGSDGTCLLTFQECMWREYSVLNVDGCFG